jgi:polyisoprenoid-binding protein YceI
MLKQLSFFVVACALSGTARAAPEEFALDPGHTFPVFEVRHLGITTQRGRFNRTTGKVMLDRDTGAAAVELRIDARSVDTGNEELDQMLRNQYYFNVAAYPEITYAAASFTLREGEPSTIDGHLTFLGVTKPVPLKVLGFKCTRLPAIVVLRCGADLSATFKRSDFGLTTMAGFVSDEVTLVIQAEAVRQAPAER